MHRLEYKMSADDIVPNARHHHTVTVKCAPPLLYLGKLRPANSMQIYCVGAHIPCHLYLGTRSTAKSTVFPTPRPR